MKHSQQVTRGHQPNLLRSTSLQSWVNRIHEGDCLKLMLEMPQHSVPLIVTSPPYNLGASSGNGPRLSYNHHDDCMSHGEYVGWQRECLAAMLDLIAPGGAIFYNHKTRVQGGLMQSRWDILDGFPVRQEIIWKRCGAVNHNSSYFMPNTERIYLIAPDDRLKITKEYRRLGEVWEIPQDNKNQYPGSFPLELAQQCIGGIDADVVLDPFVGSGTTALAAIQEGRSYIGIDISPEACSTARRRISGRHGSRLIIDYLGSAGWATPTQVIRATGLAETTFKRHWKRLLDGGQVQTKPHPEDGRSVLCSLPPAGARSPVEEKTLITRNGYPRVIVANVAFKPENVKNRGHSGAESTESGPYIAAEDIQAGENRGHSGAESTESGPYIAAEDIQAGENRGHSGAESTESGPYIAAEDIQAGENRGHSGAESTESGPYIAAEDIQAGENRGHSGAESTESGPYIAAENIQAGEPLGDGAPVCTRHGTAWIKATTYRDIQALDDAIGHLTYYCSHPISHIRGATYCSMRYNSHPDIGEYHTAGIAEPSDEVACRAAVQPVTDSRPQRAYGTVRPRKGGRDHQEVAA